MLEISKSSIVKTLNDFQYPHPNKVTTRKVNSLIRHGTVPVQKKYNYGKTVTCVCCSGQQHIGVGTLTRT